MASTTKALVVDSQGNFAVIQKSQIPEPADNELLIKILFSGVNPADTKHSSHLGIVDTTLGYDFCGQVLQAADSNSEYKPGDIVAGYTPSGVGRPHKYGAHQAYLTCPESMLFRVPDNLPQTDAACLTVVTMTAADTLYNQFQIPLPSEKRSSLSGPLLLWGATGSVGYCALQFAAASGVYPIFVTASSDRFDHLETLGATRCFDYRADNVHESINEALSELGYSEFTYGFDAAGAPESGAQLLESVSENTQIASTLFRQDPRFKMPLATPNLDFPIQPPGAPCPTIVPARPNDYKRAWKALAWAIDHYGTLFRLLPVRKVDGSAEDVLAEIKHVAEKGAGFSKLVVQQPMA